MTWNDNPEKKYLLQFDKPDLTELGAPVYEHGKSLQVQRFYPDINIKKHLVDYVKNNGGENFFDNSNWKNTLFEQVALFKAKNKTVSSFETKEERSVRIHYELLMSKKIIENKLNKTIEFLCWPGGSGTEKGHKIARAVGYKMTTAARDIPDGIRKK
jgi:hypothetical protein